MTSTPDTIEDDRRILAAASLDSDDWDDATWAAWFRAAARAHGERFDGDTKPANARTLLGALLRSARWAVTLTKQGQDDEAAEHVEAIERLTAAYRVARGRQEDLGRGRTQLLEAMSAVSEDRTCASWCADWARTLHAEGGIWETLGRAVGWPTGNYDQWVWVSWDEAAALYAEKHNGGGE
jgi:hypothetical protein